MIGEKYTINAWGKTGTFITIMFWIYCGVLMWLMKDESMELIEKVWRIFR